MGNKNLTEGSVSTYEYGMVNLLIGLSVIAIFWYFLKNRNGRKLPPGPTGLPIFGYYLFLVKNPIKKMNEVAKMYGNVFGFYLGPQYVVVLNDWDSMTDAYGQSSTLYRPPALFSAVPFNFGVVGTNGAEWFQTRRLTSRTVKDIGLNKTGWEDLVQEEALDLVEQITKMGDKPIEVRRVFAESFLNNMLTLILGHRLPAGHPLVRKLSKGVDAIIDYTPTLGMTNFSPTLSKILQILGIESENLLAEKVNEFSTFVANTVDEKIKNATPDVEDSFMGRFLEEIQNHRNDENTYITVQSLKGNVLALLTGGGETTRTTIIWTLMAMAENPEKQQKVHEELDAVIGKDGSIRWGDRFKIPYTYATFLESMRWSTIVPFNTFRMATEDTQIQGYHIPKGTFITVNNWLLHHDPRYWKNSEEFIPERFLIEGGTKVSSSPDSFNPFSYGKRNCPGKLLAQMEGLLYFVVLMQKFRVMPKHGSKVEYDTILGLTFQAINVELRFVPR